MYEGTEEEFDDDKWDDDEYRCALTLRFPTVRPPTEEIMALHPHILYVDYPIVPSARSCCLIFADRATANEARKVLSNVVYKEKGSLVVNFMRNIDRRQQRRSDKDQKRKYERVYLSGLPQETTAKQLEAAFPTCVRACAFNKSTTGLLMFIRNGSAEAVVRDKESHHVNGAPITLDFLNGQLVEDGEERRRKKRVEQEQCQYQPGLDRMRRRKEAHKARRMMFKLGVLTAGAEIDPAEIEMRQILS